MADLVKVAPDLKTLVFQTIIVLFDSLYESFQALTSIQVSHFVEWFSGDTLDSIWTQSNHSGVGTFAMADEVDGGFKLSCGASSGNNSTINFNDKRHYSFVSECISIWKANSISNNVVYVGLLDNPVSGANAVYSQMDSTRTNFSHVGDGTTTEGSVAQDTGYHVFRILSDDPTNVKFYIDGVLDVTQSTFNPTTKGQPVMRVRSLSAGAKSGQILYFEAFNGTLDSSLYERLSALTQIMNQRVVETFSGSVLNERWNTSVGSGSPTFAMVDAVDGGFGITSGGVGGFGYINFNNKRQYAFDDSVFIGVGKVEGNTSRMSYGLASDEAISTEFAFVQYQGNSSFITLRTGDASTATGSNSSVAGDTAYHVFKVDCSSANIKLTIDGVLEVTKTTNRPTIGLEPQLQMFDASADSYVRIRYSEAYNKLTTETDYPSVYELFNALTSIAKQHFWEWFDGSILHNRWTTRNVAGTNSFAINDAVDGGLIITTGATSNNRGSIYFNDIHPFAHDGSILIITAKRVSGDSTFWFGFCDDSDLQSFSTDQAICFEDSASTFKTLRTGDASSGSDTASDVAVDTAWTGYKIECGSANIKLTIDGVLKVTKTTNRPTIKQQPAVEMRTATSAARTGLVRYIEAKNT